MVEISILKHRRQLTFAFVVMLLACTTTYISHMWDVSFETRAVLVTAAIGYLFWPLYRSSITNRKKWTNIVLLVVFSIVVLVGVFSALAMYDGLHRIPPVTDAGDGIMMVWGCGLLGFVASSITVLVSCAIDVVQKWRR